MAFKDFPKQAQGIKLLQRSLERGRLAHAYLFTGHDLSELEAIASTLAKTLNCQQPLRPPERNASTAIDCCDRCLACQKIQHGNHADVHWVRPESKTRIITVDQMRELMKEIQLKPSEAEYKVAIIVAADRLRTEAANAFLKTLEEPPAKSVLILLSTEPQRLLETILSRCLRLNLAGEGTRKPELTEWLKNFSQMVGQPEKSLLGRYRLMDVLLKQLTDIKASTESTLKARSPLEQYKDAEKNLVEKWEDELAASVEAEYRRQRSEVLLTLQWWLRDVWLRSLPGCGSAKSAELLNFPQLEDTAKLAGRITPQEALANLEVMEKLQRWLNTNVQEALALEVGLLQLRL